MKVGKLGIFCRYSNEGDRQRPRPRIQGRVGRVSALAWRPARLSRAVLTSPAQGTQHQPRRAGHRLGRARLGWTRTTSVYTAASAHSSSTRTPWRGCWCGGSRPAMVLGGGRRIAPTERSVRVDINFLVLGIAYCGIAPPIFWSVLNKAGQSNTAERIALMERCLVVFGVGRIAVLRADREFGGEAGFRWRQAQPIPFHQRRKCDTLILNHWNRRTRVDALLAALKPGPACLLPGRRSV